MTGQSLRCASCGASFRASESRCIKCWTVRPVPPSSALVPTILTGIVIALFIAWVITYGASAPPRIER